MFSILHWYDGTDSTSLYHFYEKGWHSMIADVKKTKWS